MKSIDLEALLKQTEFRLDPDARVWASAHNEFNYNDGDDAENYVLDSIRNTEDVSSSSEELAEKIKDWPSLYHLSHRRSNLLKPFEGWFKGKRILEIGCGCGAISRFIGEAGASLISVEGSLRRAIIARERCRDLENVEVICSPSDQLPDLGKFDAVLLIGVLEYARCFLGKDGQEILLKDCHSRLVENGQLFIAIENKLGIKYFAGAPEDHVGIPMHGINSAYTNDSVATFGRYELKDLINHAGFKEIEEYLPLPDYKLPCSVVTPLGWEKYSKELASFAMESTSKDAQGVPQPTFSIEQGIINLWTNGLASDTSNSFLMIGAKKHKLNLHENIIAYHFSNERKPDYHKLLMIYEDDNKQLFVSSKRALSGYDGHKAPEIQHNIQEHSQFHYGDSLYINLIKIVNKNLWLLNDLMLWVKQWVYAISIRTNIAIEDLKLTTKLPSNLIDATPFNVIKTKDHFTFFDLEWEDEESITFGFLMYRAIFISLTKITSVNVPAEDVPLTIYDITFKIFQQLKYDVDDATFDSFIKEDYDLSRKIKNVPMFDKWNQHVINIKLKIRININNQQDTINNQQDTINNQLHFIECLEGKISEIHNSTSWYVAKPFRFISILLKHFKKIFNNR